VPAQTETTSYRRDLDISHALSHVTYQAGGVNYQREFFCSRPAEIFVAHFTADKPACYTGSIGLHDGHGATATVNGNRVVVAGN